ncbi:MAG TPA: hypothetical protein VN023_04605 [Methylovorus sp.]|nr:hypothetical protein [Methylovorus sp.]
MAAFNKIVLCATTTQLIAGVWRLGSLQSSHEFSSDPQGHAQFARFLALHANTRLYMLVDAVEEDYQQDYLPHTRGSARREMLARKLNHGYRNATFKAAHFIERQKDKRRDDRFIYVALTKSDFLQPWMQAIAAQRMPLAGVYLLSMMSELLLQRMKFKAPHILLSERLNSGLRQTYFHHGRLLISRSAPVSPAMQERMAYFYLAETEKTRLYLISQRLVMRDTPIKMVLADVDDTSRQISRHISQEQNLECVSEDLKVLAKSLGLNPDLLAQHPELMHMHLLATGELPVNLAPASYIKHYQVGNVARGIHLASVLTLLGGFCAAMYIGQQAAQTLQQTRDAGQETRLQEQKYREVAKDFPQTPIPSTELRAAVETARQLQSYAQTPEGAMHAISEALQGQPDIQIHRLRWLHTPDITLRDDKAETASATPGQVAPADAKLSDTSMLHQLVFVDGEVAGFNGDYRAALVRVNQFAEQLRRLPQVASVEVVQEPVNVSSYSRLQGSTTDAVSAVSMAAEFKLKCILRPTEGAQ